MPMICFGVYILERFKNDDLKIKQNKMLKCIKKMYFYCS